MRLPRVTRKRFHTARLALWTAQIPLALMTGLKASVPYVVFLSVAALVESAATDVDQAWRADKELREVKQAAEVGATQGETAGEGASPHSAAGER